VEGGEYHMCSPSMGRTDFVLDDLQKRIMEFVSKWVREKKTTVPRSEIIKHFVKEGVKFPTIRLALYALIRKGFIRESYAISNKTTYVQLRSI
jgi:hypothetical protein